MGSMPRAAWCLQDGRPDTYSVAMKVRFELASAKRLYPKPRSQTQSARPRVQSSFPFQPPLYCASSVRTVELINYRGVAVFSLPNNEPDNAASRRGINNDRASCSLNIAPIAVKLFFQL